MLFIYSTLELIRNLWQLKTAVFLYWCLIRALPLKLYYSKLVTFTTLLFLRSLRIGHWVRVFVIGKPFQPDGLKHSSLLDWFVSYEEVKVLWIWPLERHSLSHWSNIWGLWVGRGSNLGKERETRATLKVKVRLESVD